MATITTIGKEMYELMGELFPICRSLTGNGVRQTFEILKRHIPINVFEMSSGDRVFDWTVPKEWNIKDAYVMNEQGQRVVDFKKSNLHVVGYSVPVDKEMSLDELQPFLHSLPEQPNAIPYLTSYYKEAWGFCLSHNDKQNLKPGKYRVKIDSSLENGKMTMGDLLIPGISEKEILISTYVCHPSMANNELSGPVVATFLAREMLKQKNYYTYRFVFVPETIGSIAYISKHLATLKRNVVAGLVITCAGDGGGFSYLKSKKESTLVNKVALHVLKNIGREFKVYDFTTRGSDERQYSSPGVDLEVGSLMRTKYWEFPEYHTSLDNMDLMSPDSLQESLRAYLMCVQAFNLNHKYMTTCLCEPQLGKRGLYPSLSTKESASITQNMLNILAYSDGDFDLIDIADKCQVFVGDLSDTVASLEKHELIKRIEQ